MNRLDKLFRQKLTHHTEASPAHLWDNIESRLPSEKRRTPWIFLCAALMLCLLAGSYYTFMPTPESKTKITPHFVRAINIPSKPNNETVFTIPTSALSVPQKENKLSDKDTKSSAFAKEYEFSSVTEMHQTNSSDHVQEFPERNLLTLPERIAQRSKFLFQTSKAPGIKAPVTMLGSQVHPVKEVKACPFHYDAQNKSVDIYFSNDYGMKTLVADPSLSGHIQMRKQTETGRYSYGAGVRFGYNLSYRWNLHTGLNYSQINEKFEYTDPESNQTRLITIKDYVYDNGKIIDSIITEEVVIVPGMTKMKIFNRYRTLDIPVLARFTLFANRWMSCSAIGGVYINLTSRQQGTILGPDNKTLVNIAPSDSNGPSVFKTQLGVSGMAGASMAIHLNSSIDFLLEPHVRYFTSYMNTENYPANQKFTVAGVITGLRYKF